MKTTLAKLCAVVGWFIGVPLCIVGLIMGIKDFEDQGPRLVKLEYHWIMVQKDGWMYAPTDVDIDADPPRDPNEPVGGIGKTSDGAWKAMWRWKACGGGEYLTRELAERCVENAADDDGLFGYHIRAPKKAAPENTSAAPPAPAANSNCFVSIYGLLNCPDPTPKGEVKP